MEYEVYTVEKKVTTTGKELKKLVLQGKGKSYPDKNVTMWSDHPLFETVASGQRIDVELDVKDSKTPNPHGGFYKNKTVIGKSDKPSNSSSNAPQASQTQESPRSNNLLEFKVLPILEEIVKEIVAINGRLGLIGKANGITFDDKKREYPEMDEDNTPAF